jgi:hypothetical protein
MRLMFWMQKWIPKRIRNTKMVSSKTNTATASSVEIMVCLATPFTIIASPSPLSNLASSCVYSLQHWTLHILATSLFRALIFSFLLWTNYVCGAYSSVHQHHSRLKMRDIRFEPCMSCCWNSFFAPEEYPQRCYKIWGKHCSLSAR